MNHYLSVIATIILLGSQVNVSIAQPAAGVVTPSVNTLTIQTQDIQTLPERWQLNEQEYEYYLDLMRGPLGKWNANLDPLLALGMFAETAQEERRYAELYAQQEFDFTERVLKFQRAYRDAFDRLYPNIAFIDQRLLSPYFQHEQERSLAQDSKRSRQQYFQAGDRLLVFVPKDCPQCNALISHLSGLLVFEPDAGVDVYVLDTQNDEAVRQWASTNQIVVDGLQEQRLTLNRDEGLSQRLINQSVQSTSETLPVFLSRNGQFFQMSKESLAL